MKKEKFSLSTKEWIIIGVTFLIAGLAICVGLGYLEIGEGIFKFTH